jgi:hypothetical protein
MKASSVFGGREGCTINTFGVRPMSEMGAKSRA